MVSDAGPVTCVMTRFGLRGPRHLVPSYLEYRRVVREAREVPGLLKAAFLVDSPASWLSMSIWSEPAAIPAFGTHSMRHVHAAGEMFRRLAFDPARGPELWSTTWRLESVSENRNWGDLELGERAGAAR